MTLHTEKLMETNGLKINFPKPQNPTEVYLLQRIEDQIAIIISESMVVAGEIFFENQRKYLLSGEFKASREIIEFLQSIADKPLTPDPGEVF